MVIPILCGILGLGLVAGSCTGRPSPPRVKGTRGGTLRVFAVGHVDWLDTAISYSTFGWELEWAYARRLYGYDTSAPSELATVPVPDVASGPPALSADHRTYTFRLRSGVRYAHPVDREVTAEDFITAIERLYEKATPSPGQPYADLILGAREFGAGTARTITGLQAADARTLTITLVRPAGDFLSILALSFFAPVPKEYAAHYTVGANYNGHVVGSGPYTVDRYVPGHSIALARNPNWDPATDPLRKAWVDRIEVTEGYNRTTIEQAVERSAADLPFDTQPPPSRLPALTSDPELSKRTRSVITGCVNYLTLETSRAAGPIADVRVRRAINYAIDKVAAQQALGTRAGTITSTILPPTSAAYRPYDLYPTPDDRGDPGKARDLLAQAGYPDGLTLGYVGSNTGPSVQLRAAVQASLARAGIRLRVKTYSGVQPYTESLAIPRSGSSTGWARPSGARLARRRRPCGHRPAPGRPQRRAQSKH